MTDSARDPLLDVHPGDRWLVAVAHPDDESFGCGSTIAYAATRGADVTVVCATRGEAGETVPGTADGDLGTVREAELRRAAARLGVARVDLLGYRDSGFDGDLPGGSLCAAPVEEVAAVLGSLIREQAPQVLLTLDGSDGHRDHLHVGAAVREAVAALEGPAPLLVEQCLPNSLLRRWLDEMRAVRPDTAYHALDPAGLGRDDADITDVVGTSDVLDRREAAIAEHRSQVSPFEGLSEGLRRAFLTVDHLARVRLPDRSRQRPAARSVSARRGRFLFPTEAASCRRVDPASRSTP
ncbi:PIG-L deacetylase family protein [Blastococcus litoris]|uniref:PIG-L deacetylase family protein n=1 Tax=Blastococcus litoris TaxID=2171622 RepID=UPI000E3077FA|nr:PIG-L family deacetylase [Blastococcus litoris]